MSTSETCITCCAPSNSLLRSVSAVVSRVDDFALTSAQRALFRALAEHDVPFMLLGLGAALLEGAPVATQDLDVWSGSTDDQRIAAAARAAGGFWISGFGMQPPAFGGVGLGRVHVVLTAHGLDGFAVECSRSVVHIVDGIPLHVLPLGRIIHSKRATDRAKDQAQLPILEATLLARNTRGEPGP